MDFYGCYFHYADTASRKYGLIFANVDTSRVLFLAGQIKSNTIFCKGSNRNCFLGQSFEDSPIQIDAEIVVSHDGVIEPHMQREIEKWLFYQSGYRKLYIESGCDTDGESIEFVDGQPKRQYLNCRFVNPEKIEGNGGIIGYKFLLECDSCMAWQDAATYRFDINHDSADSNSTITVDVDTDLLDYIYPKVTIQIGNTGGNITIANQTDSTSRLTTFVDMPPNTGIVMNGDGIRYVSGGYYQNFSNRNFIRLLDGENRISVTGNVSELIFEFRNRRYI